jgi:MarR family transcriptional regulator, negative regulator of the multidrug operon emrRAB
MYAAYNDHMDLARTANLLGALSVAVVDRVADTTSVSAGHGATAPAALATLLNSSGISVGELATVLGLTHPGTVRLVDRLVADGLVSRHRGADGREVSLRLDAKGRRTARAVLAARAAVLEEALSALGPDDMRAFERVACRLLAALTPNVAIADHICRLCDDRACPSVTCPVEAIVAARR